MNTDRYLYPLTFAPVLKDYVWGGHALANRLGRPIPANRPVAESWEIAGHANGTTNIANGRYAGRSLNWLLAEFGDALVGSKATWALARKRFPLLIKLLDAAERLSVQVHPDDAYALAHEGNELGKSEMWVVLHAEPEAAVILGLQRPVTRKAFQDALVAGELEPLLHTIPVQSGDHVCVPAGSLHAILGGILIAEIQQNSDTTYRVFDWNRVGNEGVARPLHVSQAMDVINFDQIRPARSQATVIAQMAGRTHEQLCANDYFVVERLQLGEGFQYVGNCDGSTLEIWGALAGQIVIEAGQERLNVPAISFTLLPAALGPFSVTVGHESATLLRIYLP